MSEHRTSEHDTAEPDTGVPESDVRDRAVHDLVGDWSTVPEVAETLDIEVTRVRQLVRERQLLAVRRAPGEPLIIPTVFVRQGHVLKGLPGLLTVLADAGFDDPAALRWLFTADESLPGSPAQALAENRGTEVKRRAQALAL